MSIIYERVVRDIHRRGYAILSFVNSQHVQSLLNHECWASLRSLAHGAEPMDEDDDPTSLGLQHFTTMNDSLQSTVVRSEFFASKDMQQRLLKEDHSTFAVSGITWISNDEQVNMILNQLIGEFNTVAAHILSAAVKVYSTHDQLIHSKCGVQHETLWNFFTPNRVSMYPHTDLCTLSLVMVPSLDPHDNDEEVRGLQVYDTEAQAMVDIESQMRGYSVCVLPGVRYEKVSNGSVKGVEHRVVGAKRQAHRVSIAHFFCRHVPS